MEYLFDLWLTLEEINKIKNQYDKKDLDKLQFFPRLIITNYNYLKIYGIKHRSWKTFLRVIKLKR